MTKIICAAMGITAALGLAPLAAADPSAGHSTMVTTYSPIMTCMVGSDDANPGIGPNVVCQYGEGNGFPGSPAIDPELRMYQHQATVTAAGELTYRDANLPWVTTASTLTNGPTATFIASTAGPSCQPATA